MKNLIPDLDLKLGVIAYSAEAAHIDAIDYGAEL
jgi:hypothetical protein